ncbi:MAG: tetratricopeptide repeat protein [Chloroflexi bacterium]|nr:MAG: tetratricopeptide repeat protein [Chloroflexota bacterium]
MTTLTLNTRSVLHSSRLLLLLIAFAFLFAACGGDTNDDTTTVTQPESDAEIIDNSKNPSATIPIPTPKPTADPKIALFNEILLLSKEANDFYLYGDMVAWRESRDQGLELIDDIEKIIVETIDYELLGFASEKEANKEIATVKLFLAHIAYQNDDIDYAFDLFSYAIDNKANQLSAALSGHGHILRQQEDDSGAIENFDQALSLDPQNADAYRGLAMISYFDQDYDAANQYLDKALEINPNFGLVYYWQGVIAEDLGDKQKALSLYIKAGELDPGYEWSFYYMAFIYHRDSNFQACINSLTHAIEIREDSWFYSQRGYCYKDRDDYSEALLDYNKAIELNTNDRAVSDSYGGIGDISYYEEDYSKAAQEYTHAIELNPSRYLFYSNRGDSYVMLDNYEEAINDFDKAIELNPEHIWSYFGRAVAYEGINDNQSAYADYGMYLSLESRDTHQARLACARMNALHLYNSENILDLVFGTGCDRFPSDSGGATASGNSGSDDLSNCRYGVLGDRCMTANEYYQSAHTP